MAEDNASCLVVLVMIVVGIFAVYVVVKFVIPMALAIIGGTGCLVGAATSVWNYVVSLWRNVRLDRPEEIPPETQRT